MDTDDGIFICIVIASLAWFGLHIADYYAIMTSHDDYRGILQEIESLDKPIINTIKQHVEYAFNLLNKTEMPSDLVKLKVSSILSNISTIIHYHVMFLPNDQSVKDAHLRTLQLISKLLQSRMSKRTSIGSHS